MAALDKYKLGARRLAATGQMIGDAFIWPFYRSSGDILIEHSKESYQPFIPSGLGGLGELKFISGQKKLLDHFVIYHGVTSFLRMGDISLVDVNTQAVVALGDIKTSVDGQKMNIRVGLSFVAKTDSNIYEKMLDLRKRPRQPRRGNQQHRAETKLDEQVIEFKNAMLAHANQDASGGLTRS